MKEKITISLIKADIGSVAGHHVVHPKQLELARELLEKAKKEEKIIDYYVFNCGDDLGLLITSTKGENSPEIHELAWNTFKEVTERVSKPLKLYASGQDLLIETFSGNIKGMGPGVAEMEIEERPSEPFVIFAADKTEPGAWNLPLFRMFADPMNTAGLVINPNLQKGFTFRVVNVIKGEYVDLSAPREMYELLALIGTTGRYVIEKVFSNFDNSIVAVCSTTRLSLIKGRYVGKDDPVMIVRCQMNFPAVGEVLAPFAFPHLVAGFCRGSHYGPLLPVSLKDARCTFFDGPPRVIALGFQLCTGKLIGLNGKEPADLFADVAFDEAREKALEITEYIRGHGEFMPARLGPEEMEYTSLPEVLEKLKDRWVKE
ncbi:MAG: fructose-1,6-bisphosphate aldolase/phosphatase [Candidatus Aenigmarchaeota archaeon]|nr:fructose-1,6-bisphosphate aldolase/phosphatase [Candidatus Aenigmarchaeota archaeon]